MEEAEGPLVSLCLDAATATRERVEGWRRKRRTLERLPSPLASALFHRLRLRRLLFPSLLEVFQQCLEDVDLNGEGCVDAEWMAYLGGFRYLASLNLAGCKAITDSALWSISGIATLKELNLSRCSRITDAGVRHLLVNTSLEKLLVSETKLTGDGVITCFGYLKSLRVLDLGGLPVTDKALSSLEVLEHLEHLDLWGSKVTDKGVARTKAFTKLNFLNVAWTSVHAIPVLSSITCLNMSYCTIDCIFHGDGKCPVPLSKLILSGSEFKNENKVFSWLQPNLVTFLDLSQSSLSEFHLLAGMRQLVHLNLSNSKMTDELIGSIASIGANLKHLDLSNTKVTSTGISILVGNVPKLRVLSLSHTMIEDSSLSFLGMMPDLKFIDLSYTKIRGCTYSAEDNREKSCSFTTLDNLCYLESLNVQGIPLTNDTLQPLFQIKGLKSLSLKSDHLTDISIHMMSHLRNLEFLGFCGTVMTDTGLLTFHPPSTLMKLDLRGCWLLSEYAISSFHKQFPHIEVKHELLQPSSANQNAIANLSGAHGAVHPLQMRSNRGKSSESSRLPMMTFADERLKYSLEELLELQHSPLSHSGGQSLGKDSCKGETAVLKA